MQTLKELIKKYFTNFAYFYRYMRYRIFVILILSLLVGLMDGLGIAMFLPLLEIVADEGADVTGEKMGKLGFLVEGLQAIGLDLNLTVVLLIMLSFFSLKGGFIFFKSYKNVVYKLYFIRNLREQTIKALADFRYNEFVKSDAGMIQNAMTGEIGRVVSGYTEYMKVIQQSMLLIVYTSLALLSNFQFALLVAVGGVLTNFVFTKIYVYTKDLSRKLSKFNSGFQGLIIQQVAQFKYLKATGLINFYADKLIKKVYQIEAAQKKIGILNAIVNSIREPLLISVVVLVILVQVNLLGGNLGTIILSILFFYRALTAVMQLQTDWNKFLSKIGSLELVDSFSKELKAGKEKHGKKTFSTFKQEIRLENVQFSYDDTVILRDITLSIGKNETIAFVGESGSGKTTLMNIISGLLIPEKGKMYIDGVKSSNINLKQFQKRIGYITQEPVVFSDTIYDNVTFWSPRNAKSMERFRVAAKRANILDFIESLPDKHNTLLGNNGINLSGGQKQRISIARELYKEVDFLFLDEATSALDSETELQIQHNIDDLKGEFTILIIAHRLSTIKNADRVVVLDNGRIEQVGNYQELVSKSDSFKRMVSLQEV